jgi:hypothetical protein
MVSRSSSSKAPEASWRSTAERIAGIGAWVGCAALLIILATVVLPRLRSSAYGSSSARTAIRFPNAPRWMTAAEMKPIEDAAQSIVAGGTGREMLQTLQRYLTSTGWFESVEQVRLVDHDGIEVIATYATPTALVADGPVDHLCDARGHRMARDYRAKDGPSLVRVLGVQGPTPAVAASWGGTALADAIDLLHTLDAQPWRAQIAAIGVGRHGKDGTLELVTTGGSTVVWGRAPSAASAAEVPTGQKLEYLSFLYAKHGRIDHGHPTSIDVRVDCASAR